MISKQLKLLFTRNSIGIHRQFSTMINEMVKAEKFVYAKRFSGEPKLTDFELISEELPKLQDGDVLVEAIYHSVDPYMRPYMAAYPLGTTMIGGQIAKVIESRNSKFPTGRNIYGQFGWRTRTVFNPKNHSEIIAPYVLPDFGNLPISLGLGALGMPGITALYGFLEICKPKPGEMVVVSGAAGAVGNIVGQIAKIKGCKVIGIVGSDDKCEWITKELGFDHSINYKKTKNISRAIKDIAPGGIDCYFDNVGGEVSTAVMQRMRMYGRIAVCGAISGYNLNEIANVPAAQGLFVRYQLTMTGFQYWEYSNKWFEGIEQLRQWIDEGKLKYQETETIGFDNFPQAFIEMLRGSNFGKAIVKAKL